MHFDWFTVVAQIVNFLILVGLLKYFLYGRILEAMDTRERTIRARLNEAEQQSREAEHQAQAYQHKLEQIDRERRALLDEAQTQAERRRHELLAQVRRDVDETRARWHEDLSRDQASFLRELRQRTFAQVLAIARRAFRDLAEADVERQIVNAFLDRLQKLDAREWHTLAESLCNGRKAAVVQSAFTMSDDDRQRVHEVLRMSLSAEVLVQFETAPELICGIALKTPGHKVAWSLDEYLEGLEEVLLEIGAHKEENTRHGSAQHTEPPTSDNRSR